MAELYREINYTERVQSKMVKRTELILLTPLRPNVLLKIWTYYVYHYGYSTVEIFSQDVPVNLKQMLQNY